MPERSGKSRKTQPVNDSYGHMQPQAVEMEKVVLGALMIDKDAFAVVSDILYPETFYDPRHQKIYQAIRSLNMAERPVDIMTVVEQLKKDSALESIGGPVYVAELSSMVATSAHIEYHAHVLAQKYIARQMISYAGTIGSEALDDSTDVDELIEKAERMLFELTQKNIKQDFVQIDSVIDQAVSIITKNSKNQGALTGVPSGFHKLDSITSGWQPSDLVIIAGRPAMGKTSFALSIAKNVAIDQGIPTAFFSLEMNDVQLVNRLISNTCEIDGTKLMSGNLDEADWKRLDSRLSLMQKKPLYIDQTPALNIFELRTKAQRLVREKGVKLIMIDYLQLMNASGTRYGNRQEEVSTISRSLKGLAKDLNIPILALSQLSRNVESREGAEGKRPLLSDLRESGAIEQDADMVLFVHRPEYYHIYEDANHNDLRGMAQIIIAKHRKGDIGDVLLNFKGRYTRFSNPEDSYMAPLPEDGIISSRMNINDVDLPPANGDSPF